MTSMNSLPAGPAILLEPTVNHPARGTPQTPHPDPDTCRICRGEGTLAEPLYYPCKCCGSIKYVHQDCLMEWLSHSQKKHCELCKTPFRFTKLYSPSMPKSLPIHIFLGHFAKHVLRSMLLWLRAAVVVSVWIFWLPYLMRSVWSFYFWISDKGLNSSALFATPLVDLSAISNQTRAPTCSVPSIFSSVPKSCPITLGRSQMTPNVPPSDLISVIRVPFVGSITTKWFRGGIGYQTEAYQITPQTSSASLLSEISLLTNLTRFPVVNRAIIAVLEGQIISIAVIISFILIILVRDYVVQQQPEINMRAAFLARDNVPGPDAIVDGQVGQQQPLPDEGDPVDLEFTHVRHRDDHEAQSANEEETGLDRAFSTLPNRPRSVSEIQDSRPQFFGSETAKFAESLRQNPSFRSGNVRPVPFSMVKPTAHSLPSRQSSEASIHEFLEIWRQSESSPENFLQIVKERNLEQRMASWIVVTESLLEREKTKTSDSDDNPIADAEFVREAALNQILDPSGCQGDTPDLPVLGSTSFQVQHSHLLETGVSGHDDKGKQKDGPHPFTPGSGQSGGEDIIPVRQLSELLSPSSSNLNIISMSEAFEMGTVEHPSASNPDIVGPDGQDATGDYQAAKSEENQIYPDSGNREAEPQAHTIIHDHLEVDLVQRDPQGWLLVRIADMMFGNIELAQGRGHEEGQDIVDGAPAEAAVAPENDDDVADNDADEAPENNIDVLDEWEELEGIMELIGLRGPIGGLFQNAVFCAVLVSVTIFGCIFLPYNLGRFTLWVIANPISVVRTGFEIITFIQDLVAMIAGASFYMTIAAALRLGRLVGLLTLDHPLGVIMNQSFDMSRAAAVRVFDIILNDLFDTTSEMQNFSAASHEALLVIKSHIAGIFVAGKSGLLFCTTGHPREMLLMIRSFTRSVLLALSPRLSSFTTSPGHWIVNVTHPLLEPNPTPLMSPWTSTDRIWATLCGYITLSLLAVLYVRRGAPFSRRPATQRWEASIIDLLNQASGVLKVIFVISIEMLVFPLYCGLLLDAALLPLFENASFSSRVLFTCKYPITSAFVHWFVGTGYMFHFALFVSMCRKIMRKGVLYFIRDPDDPDFHPVRDVLERSLTTQLRKILFSAVVYGALVIICLGGVVWGLRWAMPGVIPIHYSSNEPILEFPVDLLFYNFLMPIAVKLFKPSDSLHAMYTWWFRKCARNLRLSWFFFGERRIDEEGHIILAQGATHGLMAWWTNHFLEVNSEGEVAPQTWSGWFNGGLVPPKTALTTEELARLSTIKSALVESQQLIKSGRFVQTPASDQVKLARGAIAFQELDEASIGMADNTQSADYQPVYIPPNFRLRILTFFGLIWVFAAVTGVGLTILPLSLGRLVFKFAIPAHIRTNDIYAFSIGTSLIGTFFYSMLRAKDLAIVALHSVSQIWRTKISKDTVRQIAISCLTASKLCYAYVFTLLVIPLIAATVMELYFLIPFHTILHPPTVHPGQRSELQSTDSKHTVRLVQAWTLGILYLKLGAHIIKEFYEDTRLAIALEAITRNGWLRPDVKIISRAFVAPALFLGGFAILVPPALVRFLLASGVMGSLADNEAAIPVLYRASYPATLMAAFIMVLFWKFFGVLNRCTVLIRDEAYLIGERLHNFGVGAGRSRAAWTARGTRL